MKLAQLRPLVSGSAQRRLRGSSGLGIVSAVFLSVCVNVLAARFDRRWDATSDHRYTLSKVTHETLAGIAESVKIVVLLSRADPLAPTVQQVVAGYLSLRRQITLQWVDPDRDPGQFLALQAELGISAGTSRDGKAVSDSIIVLTHGKSRSYITADDIALLDPTKGESEPRLEQAITRGLRQLFDARRSLVCFTQGHRELSLQDEGPTGLSELRNRLGREPIDLKTIDLGAGRQISLAQCRLLVVAAPDVPLSPFAQQQIESFMQDCGSLLVLSSTIPDESGKVRSTGLSSIVSAAGISVGTSIVVERDESQRLPDGFGESFFAQITDHAVTRSLLRGSTERSLHVLVSLAPALSLADGSQARLLLSSTDKAREVTDVGAYLRDEAQSGGSTDMNLGLRTIAAAADLGTLPQGVARRLIVAPASVAENRAFRLPALVGNRAFVDGAISWLLTRPIGVEIPSNHRAPLQMNLSDADLARLNRYVLLILPGAAGVLGLAVAIGRRRRRPARRDRGNQ